uniref:Truncated non-functional calcium-binding mitochondrial carrier SAL1-1 n=1 Tax=Talaromyces marneffei PM1 TaxID=1077442 RepID=A0A093USE6_TALMA
MKPLEYPDRVDKLWEVIDTRKQGSVDFNGLRKGLRRMDHPFGTFSYRSLALKNADSMLQQVFETVDTNGDGRIQYGEFRDFVSRADETLWELFKSIDRDHNGEIDRSEFKEAFATARITVSSSMLDEFLAQMDQNNDGVISYNEWRDFLLFLPIEPTNLGTVLSYYKATGNLNPEGDVDISDTLQGLGYFIAGGVAGAVSRTATAPLDRLKVYLIAHTGVREEVVCAAQKGAPVNAMRKGIQSLVDATKELWKAGGIRSLFAGSSLIFHY